MSADAAGRNLFIVHDSVSSWTGLRYLKERAGISRSFDFATGFFDIGALLEPDGEWQRVDRIRLLMGTETSHRTPRALIDSVRARAVDALDRSLEDDKQNKPNMYHQLTVAENYTPHSDADFLRWYFSSLDLHPDCRRRCTLLVDPGRGSG